VFRRKDWLRVTYGAFQDPSRFLCSPIDVADPEHEIGCTTQQGASFALTPG
jgi:hypothetical protein